MKHVYFCRHGESVRNKQGLWAGQNDTPLTQLGRKQATLAGQGAATLNIDHIVSSPLIRALETAQIIAQQIGYPVDKIIVNDAFMERSYGPLEGQPFNVTPDPLKYPGIESEASIAARAKVAYEYIQHCSGSNILVVAHGTFAVYFCGLYNFGTGGDDMPNAQIVELS